MGLYRNLRERTKAEDYTCFSSNSLPIEGSHGQD